MSPDEVRGSFQSNLRGEMTMHEKVMLEIASSKELYRKSDLFEPRSISSHVFTYHSQVGEKFSFENSGFAKAVYHVLQVCLKSIFGSPFEMAQL
jgi:hypothetical protein